MHKGKAKSIYFMQGIQSPTHCKENDFAIRPQYLY